jgi:hypothetical protein
MDPNQAEKFLYNIFYLLNFFKNLEFVKLCKIFGKDFNCRE